MFPSRFLPRWTPLTLHGRLAKRTHGLGASHQRPYIAEYSNNTHNDNNVNINDIFNDDILIEAAGSRSRPCAGSWKRSPEDRHIMPDRELREHSAVARDGGCYCVVLCAAVVAVAAWNMLLALSFTRPRSRCVLAILFSPALLHQQGLEGERTVSSDIQPTQRVPLHAITQLFKVGWGCNCVGVW